MGAEVSSQSGDRQQLPLNGAVPGFQALGSHLNGQIRNHQTAPGSGGCYHYLIWQTGKLSFQRSMNSSP